MTKARLKEQRRSGKIKSKADLAREREESKMRAYEKKQATVRVRSVLVKGGSPDSRKISKATESIATATATATTTTTTTIKIPTSSVPINRAAGAPAVPFIGSPNPKNARAALLRHKK